MINFGTRKLWAVAVVTCFLTACASGPRRVSFTENQTPQTTVPGYAATLSSKPGSNVSVFLPELQYNKTPSKLVLMLHNKSSESISFSPEDDVKVDSTINLQMLYGNSAKKLLKQFSRSAFGKDCKVDPARTMTGYLPPSGWNQPLSKVSIASGQTVTGYLLLDPQQTQLADMSVQVQFGQQQHQIKINLK